MSNVVKSIGVVITLCGVLVWILGVDVGLYSITIANSEIVIPQFLKHYQEDLAYALGIIIFGSGVFALGVDLGNSSRNHKIRITTGFAITVIGIISSIYTYKNFVDVVYNCTENGLCGNAGQITFGHIIYFSCLAIFLSGIAIFVLTYFKNWFKIGFCTLILGGMICIYEKLTFLMFYQCPAGRCPYAFPNEYFPTEYVGLMIIGLGIVIMIMSRMRI